MSFEVSAIPEQWTTLNDDGVCTVSAFLSALFGNKEVREKALGIINKCTEKMEKESIKGAYVKNIEKNKILCKILKYFVEAHDRDVYTNDLEGKDFCNFYNLWRNRKITDVEKFCCETSDDTSEREVYKLSGHLEHHIGNDLLPEMEKAFNTDDEKLLHFTTYDKFNNDPPKEENLPLLLTMFSTSGRQVSQNLFYEYEHDKRVKSQHYELFGMSFNVERHALSICHTGEEDYWALHDVSEIYPHEASHYFIMDSKSPFLNPIYTGWRSVENKEVKQFGISWRNQIIRPNEQTLLVYKKRDT